MRKKIIFQLPFVKEPSCPVCQQRLKYYQPFTVFSQYTKNGLETASIYLRVCNSCKLFFADEAIIQKYGYRFDPSCLFTGNDRDAILHKAYSLSEFQKIGERFKKRISPFTIKRIICNGEVTDYCAQCHSRLKKAKTYIPGKTNNSEQVNGYGCVFCGTLYVHHDMRNRIRALINNSPNKEDFLLDEQSEYDYLQILQARILEEKRLQRLKEKQEREKEHQEAIAVDPSVIASLYVINENEVSNRIIIVKDSMHENPDQLIFYFLSDKGREYLSAGFADQRKRQGVIDGLKYTVTDVFINESKYGDSVIDSVIPRGYITIGPDGGNYSSVFMNPNNELVQVLIYAPGTGKYEPLEATYKKHEGYCYTDFSHYSYFAKKYGKPDLDIDHEVKHSTSTNNRWSDLRQESDLKSYGYNVNRFDGLSDEYRHELLGEIIDLQLKTQAEISRFLKSLIMRSAGRWPEAEDKWEADIEFVEKYRYNPTRFMIVK